MHRQDVAEQKQILRRIESIHPEIEGSHRRLPRRAESIEDRGGKAMVNPAGADEYGVVLVLVAAKVTELLRNNRYPGQRKKMVAKFTGDGKGQRKNENEKNPM